MGGFGVTDSVAMDSRLRGNDVDGREIDVRRFSRPLILWQFFDHLFGQHYPVFEQ